jgi:hypothetical protein
MSNLRFYAIGGLFFALWALSIYIVSLQAGKAKAEKKAETEKAGNVISSGTAQAVDRLVIKERTITQEVQNVIREIAALPTGEAPVSEDVADAWAAGIDGLRDDATAPPVSDNPR